MRELTIGETVLRVRATPLALLYYKQEFKSDLLGDLIKMSVIEKDMSKFDTIAILQLVWAMNKADSYGEKFPNFEKWLAALECVDFSDSAFLTAALEEAQEGFFRKAQGLGKSK